MCSNTWSQAGGAVLGGCSTFGTGGIAVGGGSGPLRIKPGSPAGLIFCFHSTKMCTCLSHSLLHHKVTPLSCLCHDGLYSLTALAKRNFLPLNRFCEVFCQQLSLCPGSGPSVQRLTLCLGPGPSVQRLSLCPGPGPSDACFAADSPYLVHSHFTSSC